jgi:chromosome segregation ATPase
MQSEETTDATVTLADRIEQAYTDVLPALIAQLYQQYEGEIAPLQAKQAGLEEEYDALEQAAQKLQAILPAQERLAQAEADRLMVSGQLQEAKAKFTELQQAQQAPAAMRERQQEIRARIRALNGRKEAITKQVFERWYGECQRTIRAAERGLFLVLLNGVSEAMFQFQAHTHTERSGATGGLFHNGHIIGLTAPDKSPEYEAGRHWYR